NATVPGGLDNIASGAGSIAAGNDAQATAAGSLVWSDSQGGLIGTIADQMLIQAHGGFQAYVSSLAVQNVNDGSSLLYVDASSAVLSVPTFVGGTANLVNVGYGSVLGGSNNTVTGGYSTILGGSNNEVDGSY